MQIVIGIITVSDRASAGDYADLGGPALKKVAGEAGWQVLAEAIVPDDPDFQAAAALLGLTIER